MDCLLLFVVVPLAAWADFLTIRGLARNHAGPLWWAALAALSLPGAAADIWCGFYCEYQFSDRLRVISFPVPAVFFHLEDGQWVDYIRPAPLLIACWNAVGVFVASL